VLCVGIVSSTFPFVCRIVSLAPLDLSTYFPH
jgi:hypothetical protein